MSRSSPDTSGYQCENCGAPLSPRILHSRVIDCEQCGSTSIRVDDAFRLAGDRGMFHDEPGLVALGHEVMLPGEILTPVGHCQFDYGRGLWDEFWCIDRKGEGKWLSVDEGDYAVETPIDKPNGHYQLGQEVQIKRHKYQAVEIDRAACTAFRGELPEVLTLGEQHDYVVFAGSGNRMATFERWPGGHGWTHGRWYSAWEIGGP